MAKGEREQVTIRMPKQDKAAFNQLCDQEARTFSEKVILWLHQELWQRQTQQEVTAK